MVIDRISKIIESVKNDIINQVNNSVKQQSIAQEDKLLKIKDELEIIEKQNQELLWAKIWTDTIAGIDWMKEKPSISPGRWAVCYNYIYVLTRILNEVKPARVLDIGLGISSTIISQYFYYSKHNNGSHRIIEQDTKWADFYTLNHRLSKYSSISICNCILKKYDDGIEYNAYDGFKEAIENESFSVISIDGPIGSKRHSRRDIVELIPNILEDSFVILIDDVDRWGEIETVKEIEKKLSDNGKGYCDKFYRSETDCCVIASVDNQYLCSL